MEPAAILNQIALAFRGDPAFGAAAQAWSQSAASILISSLWQGAAVAVVLALCLRLTPGIPARLRYGIFATGFIGVVSLPFLPALVGAFAPRTFIPAPSDSFAFSSATASHPWIALDARWSMVIVAVWLTASLIRAFSVAAQTAHMRRLWASATPVAATSLDTSQPAIPVRREFRAQAELCSTTDLDRPCVIGFFRPRILIPAWLLARFTPAELEQVVLHESEHLRRMDNWANLLQKLCLVIFPLNPALWWLERRLCAEREMACDDSVVRRTNAPRAYAACLAGLAERGLEHRATQSSAALSLGAWKHRTELAERVHRLLRRPAILSPAACRMSVAFVGGALLAGTISLSRSPQLVAFVAPANQPSRPFTSLSELGDIRADLNFPQLPVSLEGSNRSYHAVKTLAILPPTRPTSVIHNNAAKIRSSSPAAATQAPEASSPSSHSLASIIPTEIAAGINNQHGNDPKARPVSGATEPSADQTAWLVLTTYEEVRTTSSANAIQGDSVVGQPSADPTGPKQSTGISVTQLVFGLVQPTSSVPPPANAQPASNVPSTQKAKPVSNSAHPIAIPLRDGWFVIQL